MPDGKTETMTAAEFNTMTAAGGGGGASERQQQEALATWAAAAEAERPALRLLFHIPMGGNRTARAGARMKRMGAKKGVPDLCLPVPRAASGETTAREQYGALWIEMKAPGGGRMRRAQRWWRKRLRRTGHAHAVCHSWKEARRVLCSYLDGEGVPPATERRE